SYGPGSRHILVAEQTSNALVGIEPRTDMVIARYELAGAARPHGLAIDAVQRRLFVANEGNATLQTVDLRNMSVIDSHAVGDDPDVLAFDPGLHRLYVASEVGRVSVFTEREGKLVLDGDVTMPHAHTVAVDPRT